MSTGVLLINLGTPKTPTIKDVRHYLREFLSDPYVIDTNPIVRWLLVNLFILPTRPKTSAKAYQRIWQEGGSPLLVYSEKLATNAQSLLGDTYVVELGMRYGKPSISSAVEKLKNCEKIIVLPLFPQYSLAATESAIEKAKHCLREQWTDDKITVIKDFYSQESFMQAQARLVNEVFVNNDLDLISNLVDKTKPDRSEVMVVFSYHGIPERQLSKISECPSSCEKAKPCPNVDTYNKDCYRAQCYASTRLLAKILKLQQHQYVTSFQSRLGRIPWIKPYTDELLAQLIERGILNVVIACPSFVCDCLETLEEIGIRAKEQWVALGGDNLYLVPCVNENAAWILKLISSTNTADGHYSVNTDNIVGKN